MTNWYDNSWNRRRSIALSPATPVIDYQIKLILTSITLTGAQLTSGNANGNDIRFTGPDGATLQNHWIESWNATGTTVDTTIWIKVANSGTSSIYMYYGNSGVASTSDGQTTFVLFDNFSIASPSLWNEVDDANNRIRQDRVNNYRLEIVGLTRGANVRLNQNKVVVGDFVYNFDFNISSIGYGSITVYGLADFNNSMIIGGVWHDNQIMVMLHGGGISTNILEIRIQTVIAGTAYGDIITTNTPLSTTYYASLRRTSNVATLEIFSNPGRTIHISGSPKTVSSPTIDMPYIYGVGSAGLNDSLAANATTGWIDNFSLRKYASSGPTSSASVTEELVPTAISMVLDKNTCAIPCSVTATIVWQNPNATSITFRPAIIANGAIIQYTSDVTISPSPGTTGSISITASLPSTGTYNICPSPN